MPFALHSTMANDNTDRTAGTGYPFTPDANPIGGRKHIVIISIRGSAGVPSAPTVVGTNGWNDTTGFTAPIGSATADFATDQAIFVYEITPVSSVAGTITPTFDQNLQGCQIAIVTVDGLGSVVQHDNDSGFGTNVAEVTLAEWTDPGNLCLFVISKQNNEVVTPGGSLSLLGEVAIDNSVRLSVMEGTGEDLSPSGSWATNANRCAWGGEFAVTPPPPASGESGERGVQRGVRRGVSRGVSSRAA